MNKQKKILIVDDSVTTREYIGESLISAGYETVEATNGHEALQMIKEHKPDAMILDLLMPGKDGFEVLEELRLQESRLPVIVLTADVQEEVKQEVTDLGAVAFLNKPFPEKALLDTLKKIFT